MPIIGIEAIWNHCEILAFDKSVAAQFVEECNRSRSLTWGGNHERETIDTAGLLRLHHERPPNRRAADHFDKIASPHCQPPSLKARHRNGSKREVGSG